MTAPPQAPGRTVRFEDLREFLARTATESPLP